MEEFIKSLFKSEDIWRLKSFVDKMENFKEQCTTNQQEAFIREGYFIAKKMLVEREAKDASNSFIEKTTSLKTKTIV